jgi:hypothetical protein
MSNFYSTTPKGDGQSPSAPSNLKYAFDPAKSIIFDVEVFPGPRWCVGFLAPDGQHWCVDGDREGLAAILDEIVARGWTLVGYNSDAYDIPLLRAVRAGEDAFQI